MISNDSGKAPGVLVLYQDGFDLVIREGGLFKKFLVLSACFCTVQRFPLLDMCPAYCYNSFRDQSLITGRGKATKLGH